MLGFNKELRGTASDAKIIRRRSATNKAATPAKSVMMVPESSQQGTLNGLYKVNTINPPGLNSKPARKITRNTPVLTPVNPIQPINFQSNNNNVLQGPHNNSFKQDELTQKVQQWQKKLNSAIPEPRVTFSPDTRVSFGNNDTKNFGNDIKSFGNNLDHLDLIPKTNQEEFTAYKTEVNRTVDSLREELRNGLQNIQSSPNIIKRMEQDLQKVTVQQKSLEDTMKQLQMLLKSQQQSLDAMTVQLQQNQGQMSQGNNNDYIDVETFENALDEFGGKMQQEMKEFEEAIMTQVKPALQTVSDRNYWMFGTVLQDSVHLLETPEIHSRLIASPIKGTKLLLIYPMKSTHEGTFMNCRLVNDNGSFVLGWVPLWTFTPEVLAKYAGKEPIPEEPRIIYLGNFGTN